MIFYFSGTGNSQMAAKQIATITGDEVISINKCLKQGINTFDSEHPLVFVGPTYAWRIPKLVESWISQTKFEGNKNAYFILTCGSSSGNAGKYAKKLCDKMGFVFCGLASVAMPENYLAVFKTPSELECKSILEKAKPLIKELGVKIQKGEKITEVHKSLIVKLLSGPVNKLFYPFFVHDRGFRVSSECISCEKCAQRCPLNNIQMENKKPVWNGNCTHCMACIAGCPKTAIEYKKVSEGQHRHYIMEEDGDNIFEKLDKK